jgi:hypothetical protein
LAHDRQIHRLGELDQLGRVAVRHGVPFAVNAGEPQLVLEAILGPVGDLGVVESFGDRAAGTHSALRRRRTSLGSLRNGLRHRMRPARWAANKHRRLVAENGRIKLVRESLNVVAAAQALLPGGVKDLPDPEKVIFSVPPDYRS